MPLPACRRFLVLPSHLPPHLPLQALFLGLVSLFHILLSSPPTTATGTWIKALVKVTPDAVPSHARIPQSHSLPRTRGRVSLLHCIHGSLQVFGRNATVPGTAWTNQGISTQNISDAEVWREPHALAERSCPKPFPLPVLGQAHGTATHFPEPSLPVSILVLLRFPISPYFPITGDDILLCSCCQPLWMGSGNREQGAAPDRGAESVTQHAHPAQVFAPAGPKAGASHTIPSCTLS